MPTSGYLVESDHPISGRLWPACGSQQQYVRSRDVAVAMAAKSYTRDGDEIRVVHVTTGEVVFRKPSPSRIEWTES